MIKYPCIALNAMQGYFNNQIKDAELFRQINGDGECLGIVPKIFKI